MEAPDKCEFLRTEDLMVGDLIALYDADGGLISDCVKVTLSLLNSIFHGEVCCKPISITPEILEKNGFVKVENTQTSTIIYSFRESLYRIEVYDFSNITIDSCYTDSSCDIFISSIHELQHALRLCGIEKEINL